MKLRETNLKKLSADIFDVLIIGGGINGAVSAAALSGKGAKTALIDQNDFASMTSQESSNLAWGGIKYLETFEFALVRKLCKCRNQLIRNYPSTVKEIRFFTTVAKGFRFHPLLIWLGTWLYWVIGGFSTARPRYLFKSTIRQEEKVVKTENAAGGFEYSDAYLHDTDARFVFNFIRSALSSGCIATNYVEALHSERDPSGIWVTQAKNVISGEAYTIRSKTLINAAGPYADQFNNITKQATQHHVTLSKGIHLIVKSISQNKRVLTFFASDGRLFFVIPMGTRTCIGTTDTMVASPTKEVTDGDREFVLKNANALLNLEQPLTKADIIAERCGVRPLVVKGEQTTSADWMQLSRKHAVEANYSENYLTIFGGKLTDCLNVGDEVSHIVEKMKVPIPYPDYKWYGEPDEATKKRFFHNARLGNLDSYTSPDSSEKLSTRLWRRYGATAFSLLELIQENPNEAEVLIKGTEYIRCELVEATHREMVTKLEDFLRRRSKIALIEQKETIKHSAGLLEACEILFGEQAEERMNEYF
ncbi:MAG: glycerol-3-phosphate dehydrogenase/oxidase [Deltaproteobacteria bacterium]|nr:glycerol-3-phosphate dehydrogenase/oxidase [Deltaproteobacteria bacterium]MBT6504021.1 glycerol-3-phosphate dehydrogenase/oxidase [Deltaproteobacteria bacterium]MBT7713963.1 glycerol-3-phosphate dehydrogenase/oxidase [Deltaproteobacteria bacterium]